MDRDELKKRLLDGGFHTLATANPDGVYAYDLDGQFVDANDVFIARVGYTRAQMAAKAFSSVVAEKDKALARANFESAARGEVRVWQANVDPTAGNSQRSLTINVPFYSDGVCCAVLGIVRNVELLEESEQHALDLGNRLAQTLDSMTDAIFLVDREWRFTYVNHRAEEMTGLTKRQLVGTLFWEQFPDAEASEFGDCYRRAMAGAAREQRRGLSPSIGRWVDMTAYSTAEGIAIYTRDVDDEVMAQAAVDQSERRTITQAALLDASRDAMTVQQLDGTIVYWNMAAAYLYGFTTTEAVGESVRELLFTDPAEYDRARAATLEDGYWFGTLEQRSKEGRTVTVEGRWTLVSTPTGEPDSIFSVSSDITAQLQEERVKLRTQRMESLGLLAGGIAHDLNNVLTPILMSAQMLIDEQQTELNRGLVVGIERSAARGADLIRQVLTFARGADGILERVDVRELLADVDSFCRETLPKSIGVTLDLAANIPDVRGDSTQVMQVLINLIVNARDAMADGGNLRITAFSTAEGTSTGSVVIEVSDNGTGMDDEVLETIFDPFFTTKAAGSGTGLGLATSLSIAQRHGGSLTATSQVGVGTLLRLEIPAFPQDDAVTTTPVLLVPPTPSPRGDGELVLVVDDDPTIRIVNCHALEAAGYLTVSAGNGEEGLIVFGENSTRIRLVITDLMMPIMDGAAMAKTLRSDGYAGPILATSGGMRAAGPIQGVEGTRFLGKPYSTHELLRTVHELVSPVSPVIARA